MSNTSNKNKSVELAVSKNHGNSWDEPIPIGMPMIKSIDEYVNFCVSFDQKTIITAIEEQDGIGKFDLYAIIYNKNSKQWEKPFNLGPMINTADFEDFPYIAPDGKTLYWSSTGRLGYGRYDVYMSQRLDDSWTKWTEPINLGPAINSKADDTGFSIAARGDYAYLKTVNMEDTAKSIDIYGVTLPKFFKQKPLAVVKGRIANIESERGLPSIIRFKEKGSSKLDPQVFAADGNGNFSFVLEADKDYELVIESSRHFKIYDTISTRNTQVYKGFNKTYKMESYLDSGQVSIISNLLFEFGTSKIVDSTRAKIDKLIVQLQEQNKSVIEIGGHTDDVGADDFNQRLSEARANAVVDVLVSKGIRAWRLKAKGYGEQVPIAPNDTEEGRKLNRRVEMLILEDDFSKKYNRNTSPKTRSNKSKYSLLKNSRYEIKN